MVRFVRWIDKFSDWTGKVFSVALAYLTASIVYEVVMRYAFDSPTNWVHEWSGYVYVSVFMLGGAYAIRHNAHVNVDIFYGRLSDRGKAIMDIVTAALVLLVCWMLVRYGWIAAVKAITNLEHSNSPLAAPIYLPKAMVAIGAITFTLQVLSKLVRDIYMAFGRRKID